MAVIQITVQDLDIHILLSYDSLSYEKEPLVLIRTSNLHKHTREGYNRHRNHPTHVQYGSNSMFWVCIFFQRKEQYSPRISARD